MKVSIIYKDGRTQEIMSEGRMYPVTTIGDLNTLIIRCEDKGVRREIIRLDKRELKDIFFTKL